MLRPKVAVGCTIKYDGYRLLAFLDEREVRLITRNRNDWTVRFPSIQASVRGLKARSAVLDLEAAMVEPSGRTDFHGLQQALGEVGDSTAIVGMRSICCISTE
jgi:bifunctional non-homologous end joining protein LigD